MPLAMPRRWQFVPHFAAASSNAISQTIAVLARNERSPGELLPRTGHDDSNDKRPAFGVTIRKMSEIPLDLHLLNLYVECCSKFRMLKLLILLMRSCDRATCTGSPSNWTIPETYDTVTVSYSVHFAPGSAVRAHGLFSYRSGFYCTMNVL